MASVPDGWDPVPDRIGSESPLSATWRPAVLERAVLVGLDRGAGDEGLDELDGLARAAGAEPVGRGVQARAQPGPATVVGQGELGGIPDLVARGGRGGVSRDDRP